MGLSCFRKVEGGGGQRVEKRHRHLIADVFAGEEKPVDQLLLVKSRHFHRTGNARVKGEHNFRAVAFESVENGFAGDPVCIGDNQFGKCRFQIFVMRTRERIRRGTECESGKQG